MVKRKLVEAVVRILSILVDLTRTGGMTRQAIAVKHGVTKRTVSRDFAVLEAIGVPISEEPGDGPEKVWRIAFTAHLEKLAGLFTAGHYLALRVAVGSSAMMRSVTGLFAFIEDLTDKIEKVIGKAGRTRLARIEACFYWFEKGVWKTQAPDIFWPLIDAIMDERVCIVSHRSPRPDAEWTDLKILPLKLFVHNGAMYLMHWSFKYQNVGVLNMHRVRRLDATQEHMARPKDFDPAKFEKSAFGVFGSGPQKLFRMIFDRDTSCFIRERTWVSTQGLLELAGEKLEMCFECADSPEVIAFVLSWLTGVVVQGPQSLRDQLYQFGLWLVATYGPPQKQEAPGEKAGSPSQHDVVT